MSKSAKNYQKTPKRSQCSVSVGYILLKLSFFGNFGDIVIVEEERHSLRSVLLSKNLDLGISLVTFDYKEMSKKVQDLPVFDGAFFQAK